MAGHIKLDRKILNWEWYQDGNTCRLFIHLLLTANHKENKWQGIVIGRGQLITGTVKLASALKLGRQNIRTSLDKLKLTNEITIKITNKYSIITICKYDVYQSFKNETNQQINQLDTNNQPTTNQQLTTNNNDNNNKEGKEEYNNATSQKLIEDMIVLEMMKVWKQHHPTYREEKEDDYHSCLQIAYKIAEDKGFRKPEVLNGKLAITVAYWDEIVQFIRADNFYRKLSLDVLSKRWQGVMNAFDENKLKATETTDKKKNPYSFI